MSEIKISGMPVKIPETKETLEERLKRKPVPLSFLQNGEVKGLDPNFTDLEKRLEKVRENISQQTPRKRGFWNKNIRCSREGGGWADWNCDDG